MSLLSALLDHMPPTIAGNDSPKWLVVHRAHTWYWPTAHKVRACVCHHLTPALPRLPAMAKRP